jgi:hypothetical protein
MEPSTAPETLEEASSAEATPFIIQDDRADAESLIGRLAPVVWVPSHEAHLFKGVEVVLDSNKMTCAFTFVFERETLYHRHEPTRERACLGGFFYRLIHAFLFCTDADKETLVLHLGGGGDSDVSWHAASSKSSFAGNQTWVDGDASPCCTSLSEVGVPCAFPVFRHRRGLVWRADWLTDPGTERPWVYVVTSNHLLSNVNTNFGNRNLTSMRVDDYPILSVSFLRSGEFIIRRWVPSTQLTQY